MEKITLPQIKKLIDRLESIEKEQYPKRDRYVNVSEKSTIIGWTVHTNATIVVIKTFKFARTPPYQRHKTQKAVDITKPKKVVVKQINNWWNNKVIN